MEPLASAVAAVPPGAWAVGVSGGADSVALLSLLHERADLALHVVHLHHETRGADSAVDAEFVAALADRLGIPHTIARLSDIESTLGNVAPNPSARYRAARLALFHRVVERERLLGVILAHHADDQAETVLQRLLRGSAPAGVSGIKPTARVGKLVILHPLLAVPRNALRAYLEARHIPWREDASNASPAYQRNRLRHWLAPRPHLRETLLQLGSACGGWEQWLERHTPKLVATFTTSSISDLCDPLARHAARRWLVQAGAPPDELSAEAVGRLVEMTRDAASPARQHFPGGVLVRRRRGEIFVGE